MPSRFQRSQEPEFCEIIVVIWEGDLRSIRRIFPFKTLQAVFERVPDWVLVSQIPRFNPQNIKLAMSLSDLA